MSTTTNTDSVSLSSIYDLVFPEGHPFRRSTRDADDDVEHEDGQHRVTFGVDENGVWAYVELWHDEDPRHDEAQLRVTSLAQAARLIDDPTSAKA